MLKRRGTGLTRIGARQAKCRASDGQIKMLNGVLKVCGVVWVDLDRFGDAVPAFHDCLGKTPVFGQKGVPDQGYFTKVPNSL